MGRLERDPALRGRIVADAAALGDDPIVSGFMHPDRIADPAVNILEPELLMYEPREDGTLRLIGVELLVFQEDWHAAGNEPVPVQLGREFGINMTLLDRPFYALHAWVWQYNPLGFFANWNPLVDCEYETVHGEEH